MAKKKEEKEMEVAVVAENVQAAVTKEAPQERKPREDGISVFKLNNPGGGYGITEWKDGKPAPTHLMTREETSEFFKAIKEEGKRGPELEEFKRQLYARVMERQLEKQKDGISVHELKGRVDKDGKPMKGLYGITEWKNGEHGRVYPLRAADRDELFANLKGKHGKEVEEFKRAVYDKYAGESAERKAAKSEEKEEVRSSGRKR